jgi:HPt (histidine-containing phosphotransfer) domain-containing protein
MSSVAKLLEAKNLLASTLAEDPHLKPLVESFARELPGRFAAIGHAVEQRDLTRVRRLLHQLKGTAGSFGFTTIAELAGAIERQDCDLDRLREILDRLAARHTP